MKICLLSMLCFLNFAFLAQSQTTKTANDVNYLLDEYIIGHDPGIAISVIQDGQVIYKENRGYANLEHMVPITDSTRFVVGSISKQFTAFAILLLEDQNKLSVNDDITKYLPELIDIPHTITIRHFLKHTSGFRENTDLNSLRGRTDLDRTSQSELVNLLLRQQGLNFVPGDRFQYCNSGYVLLAEIVERVSGMSFATFCLENIFKPLQMKNSVFVDDPDMVVKNKALSYAKYNDEYYLIPINRSVVGSTGLATTVEDLSIWASNFERMTIGNKDLFHRMELKGQLNNGTIIPYALGQELKMYKGLEVIFHGGGDAGYRSYLLRVPAHKLNIAISGNFESFNPLNIAYGLIDIFLADEIQESTPIKVPQYSTVELQNYEGDYQVFPGFYITIEADRDSLFLSVFGSEDRLFLPVKAENQFVFTPRAHSKLVFNTDGFDWHFSDFHYPAKRVQVDPPIYSDIDLDELTGTYRSEELETSYQLVVIGNRLIAQHNFNNDVELQPIDTDSFITEIAHIGRVDFTRDDKGQVTGCRISGQSSYDVEFTKDY